MSTQSLFTESTEYVPEQSDRSRVSDSSGTWLANRNLPSRYYLDHFNEFLNVIQTRYRHTLAEEHNQFIADFASLHPDAQCLYVRMLNRQGVLFDSRKLQYAEIPDTSAQLGALEKQRFCCRLDRPDAEQWLVLITRQKLLELIAMQCSSGSFRRSWPKPALLDFALDHLDLGDMSIQQEMSYFVRQLRCPEMEYLLFLYFGKAEQSLGKFTLRDLGVMRTGAFKKDFQARFDTREDAQSTWFYCQQLRDLDVLSASDCVLQAESVSNWISPVGEQSMMMRNQLLFRLGEKLEKNGEKAMAIDVYSESDAWPATEKKVRLIYASGDKQRAETDLMAMIDDPSCDDELLFARDFYQRKYKKKRTSKITDILRDAKLLQLDESFRDNPEQGVAAYYRSEGATVYFAENRIWKSLFGLIFWPLLYENENAGLYNDFEKRPRELDDGRFYKQSSREIEHVLDALADPSWTQKKLVERVTRYYGVPNGVFLWRPSILEELQQMVAATSPKGLSAMLRRMAKDYANNHSGFPDLLVIESGSARFIEVKAEGDQLRRNQLKQIVAMEDAGLEVEVNRLEWICDPDQIYVVVDIETTGSRARSNRVTEIAAVKIRGNEVIDEWQSLINPCRSIPANITQLTGITNQMVSDAPVFQEVAEAFEQFSEGAVFVAHNVRFDYGFICDEFRRIDRIYRRPTLCTCVEMRKWYKGLRSYSLANLCAEYEIELTTHHRAMCDAKAASELLFMINEKRLDLPVDSMSAHMS